MQAIIKINMDTAAFADPNAMRELGRILIELGQDRQQDSQTDTFTNLCQLHDNKNMNVGYMKITRYKR